MILTKIFEFFQMMFDIEIDALESIVKDGMKEMVSHVAGKSRDAKKRPWVIAVKAAMKDYQDKVKEEFLPVLVDDFGREVAITFTGGKMSEEDIEKLKLFMEKVDKSNIEKLIKKLVKQIDDLKDAGGKQELNARLEGIKNVAKDGH